MGGAPHSPREGEKIPSVLSTPTPPPESALILFQKILLCPLLKFGVKWRGALGCKMKVGVQASWFDTLKPTNSLCCVTSAAPKYIFHMDGKPKLTEVSQEAKCTPFSAFLIVREF